MPAVRSTVRATLHAQVAAAVGGATGAWQAGTARVLTFHGLRREEENDEVLDSGLHLPVRVFQELCEWLQRRCQVVPLREVVAAVREGAAPWQETDRPVVALTFDDGYASNAELALPVLQAAGLPATVFVSTAFLDGQPLWFQALDRALASAPAGTAGVVKVAGQRRQWTVPNTRSARREMLHAWLAWMKTLPTAERRAVEEQLQARLPWPEQTRELPELLRPLSWEQARALRAAGVELGGHMHSHPILARGTVAEQEAEIQMAARRLREELGAVPELFAYPNGGPEDFDALSCAPLLAAVGHRAAFSMETRALRRGEDVWQLPRFGAPETVAEMRATVTGGYEMLGALRRGRRGAVSELPPVERPPCLLHFIHSAGGGGAEALLRDLVIRLAGGRWRVVVVVVDGRAHPEAVATLRQAADAFYDLEAEGFLRWPALRGLFRVLRRERPDVVQTWMHHADLIGGAVARLAGVRRVLWSIHCREIHRHPGEAAWRVRALEWALARMASWLPTRIVSCSRAAVEDHAGRGYPREKMRWLPNGIDVQRFRPDADARASGRRELGLEAETEVVGFAGRLHEMKNLPLLLRAFAQLRRLRPGVQLLLAGVEQAELEAAHGDLVAALEGAVQVLAFLPKMEQFYPMLDVFCLSSRTEACPLTLLEAMACGVPCVATDVGDCGALIGESGVVVPPEDEAALTAALGAMLERVRRDREAMATAARRRVEEAFTLERAVADYAALYDSLLEVVA
ncbi:MAG: glycosyltransferase [Verrucomicrobiales bacterium]|nr:glycosyltransferase [Verrucomicrobiales bacterium]